MKVKQRLASNMAMFPVIEDIVFAISKSKLTYKQLTSRAGIAQNSIGNMRDGMIPTLPTMQSIASLLGFEVRLVPKGEHAPPVASKRWPIGSVVVSTRDGVSGEVVGHYVTRERRHGVVVQLSGTKVVMSYDEDSVRPWEGKK